MFVTKFPSFTGGTFVYSSYIIHRRHTVEMNDGEQREKPLKMKSGYCLIFKSLPCERVRAVVFKQSCRGMSASGCGKVGGAERDETRRGARRASLQHRGQRTKRRTDGRTHRRLINPGGLPGPFGGLCQTQTPETRSAWGEESLCCRPAGNNVSLLSV